MNLTWKLDGVTIQFNGSRKPKTETACVPATPSAISGRQFLSFFLSFFHEFHLLNKTNGKWAWFLAQVYAMFPENVTFQSFDFRLGFFSHLGFLPSIVLLVESDRADLAFPNKVIESV